MDKLSIVVPVYYNEDNLRPLYRDIKEKVLDKRTFDYEIVMVDDGSLDKSWDVMKELADQDEHIRLVHLSRNFGSHAAILCGLTASTGDCAVVKAADLQEPSELIPEMYQAWKEGSNVVLAVRNEREDKSFFSELYYWLMRKVALPSMPKHGFDVFLIDRKVIKTLELMDEKNSALTGQILWSGFKTKIVYYNRRAREIGKSKWTLKKKFKLVFDTLFSFSTVPITVVTWLGVISAAIAVIWGLSVFVSKLLGRIPVQGFAMLFIFQLFSFGTIMMTLGLLGNYLWRTFDASRGRPIYIVEDRYEKADGGQSHAEDTDQEQRYPSVY